MSDIKYFIDRFTDSTYTISKFDGENYIADIAFVNNYHNDNPSVTFTQSTNFKDLTLIYDTIKDGQEDVDLFSNMLVELNSEK